MEAKLSKEQFVLPSKAKYVDFQDLLNDIKIYGLLPLIRDLCGGWGGRG